MYAGGEMAAIDFSGIALSLKALAVFFSVIVCAYAGFVLMTSENPETRNEWKEIIAGVIIGLCILFLAPIMAGLLTGGSYCGS
jgi:Na+-transporting NADH:ubiquinone oxidoreductase subunit NqrB